MVLRGPLLAVGRVGVTRKGLFRPRAAAGTHRDTPVHDVHPHRNTHSTPPSKHVHTDRATYTWTQICVPAAWAEGTHKCACSLARRLRISTNKQVHSRRCAVSMAPHEAPLPSHHLGEEGPGGSCPPHSCSEGAGRAHSVV